MPWKRAPNCATGPTGASIPKARVGFTESRRLVKQGAEVILAACATVNAIIRRENLKEVDGALIMDCNAVLLKTTEAMADLSKSIGMGPSQRLLYQRPQRKSVDDWKRIYNFRAEPQLSA